jgi:hypothetical protein
MPSVHKELHLVCDSDGNPFATEELRIVAYEDKAEAVGYCQRANEDWESSREESAEDTCGPFTVETFAHESCAPTSSLDSRQIRSPCPTCKGLGRRHYSNGATWRGGVGTCSIEPDVCDSCWGSGDSERPFEDRRKLEAAYEQRIREATLERWLGERGALTVFGGHDAVQQWILGELIAFIDSLERRRKNPPPYGSWSAIDAMRSAMELLLGKPRDANIRD